MDPSHSIRDILDSITKMERTKVYDIIDGERNYQNGLNPGWNHKGKAGVGEEILLMEEYLNQARELWTKSYGDNMPALNKIRSVAALCVRCMENHGCPQRESKFQ